MKTEIIGTKELMNKLEKINQGLKKAAQESVLKQAEMVRDRIESKAPVGPTGNLKRSAIAKLMPKKANYPPIAIAGIDRKIAPHAHLVEYGHGGPHPAPAHPFFRPAVSETLGKAKENLEGDLKKGVDSAI